MTFSDLLFLGGAGVLGGLTGSIAGLASVATYPALLVVGLPPVTANVSNNIGLVPGSLSGAIGYRRELVGQQPRVLRLAVGSVIGAVVGILAIIARIDLGHRVSPRLLLPDCY